MKLRYMYDLVWPHGSYKKYHSFDVLLWFFGIVVLQEQEACQTVETIKYSHIYA